MFLVVDWLSDFMRERYRNMRLKKLEEENDPWPPVKTKSYITLALMYQQDIQTRAVTTETIFLRTKGDISAIPGFQKLTDLTQIFSSHSDSIPKVILIEGHPGIGKTTLVKEICTKWAEGKLLSSEKLVLLLLLRDPIVQKITNVQQLIEYYTQATGKVMQLQSCLEDSHGADVTLIIDGFDELSTKLRRESLFVKLIEKKLLPKLRIVVTSRPTASTCLHHIVDRRIEILGFDQASRKEYCKEALKGSSFKLEKLQKHFQQYPNIDAICYIPLIMSIIVFLCICQPEELPSTAHKMYASFILHTICHYLKRIGKIAEDECINTMQHLSQPIQQALQELEKIAFNGLVEDKIVFTIDELPDMCRDNPTFYGLLQCVRCYSSTEIGTPINSFNFLHLGIQEYFAAKYVATLPEDVVYKLLMESFFVNKFVRVHDQNSKSVRLSNLWIMYCGITSGHCNSLRKYLAYRYDDSDFEYIFGEYDYIRIYKYHAAAISSHNPEHDSTPNITGSEPMSILSRQGLSFVQDVSTTLTIISQCILEDPVKVLYLFQCFQEAEDDKLCDILYRSFDSGEINLSNHSLLPHQVVSLGFFLSRSPRQWKVLNMYKCYIGDHGINLLHRYICGDKACKQEITSVYLNSNNLTGSSSHLIGGIITCLQPHTLTLGANNITRVKDVSTAIVSTNTVKELHMWSNSLTTEEASALSDMMSCLELLNIMDNQVGDDGALILAEGLVKTNTLRELNISNNEIGSTGAVAIVESLSSNTSLKVLDISGNTINEAGASTIADALTKNKILKELSLFDNNTSIESAMIIMKRLHNNDCITTLRLTLKLMNENNVKEEIFNINNKRKKNNIQEIKIGLTDIIKISTH